jgi:integrase
MAACSSTSASGIRHRALIALLYRSGPRIHAHGLRHTHAAQLREEGVDIGMISKQLGHSSISTTAHYLNHIASCAVLQSIFGRQWP